LRILAPRKNVALTSLAVIGCTLVGSAALAVAAHGGSSSSTIVGRWSRTTTCRQFVDALSEAGLRALAPGVLAGNGLVSGTPKQLAAKANICSGATPRVHSHFFTRDGLFGSVDWNDKQVDDGHYKLVGNQTIRIGDATFRYRVTAGRLSLTPLISLSVKREALAHPLEFSTAGWMIAVALPGGTWKRVPCNQWC
jgi:hypothetical protein